MYKSLSARHTDYISQTAILASYQRDSWYRNLAGQTNKSGLIFLNKTMKDMVFTLSHPGDFIVSVDSLTNLVRE